MIRIVLATIAAVAFASAAQAGKCAKSTASGFGATKEIATAASVQSLKELMAKNGEKAKGKIVTTCDGPLLSTCKSSQRGCK